MKNLVLLFVLLFLECFECSDVRPPGSKKLGVFWGANLAWETKAEETLKAYCDRNTYDIILIQTLTRNGLTGNKDDLPSLTLANHCNDNTVAGWEGYYSYLKCPSLEGQIKYCQSKGIKILLDIGSGVYHIGFRDDGHAKDFARQLWNVFLGGEYAVRTFGTAVLDGINLSLRKSAPNFMTDFVKEMRHILDTEPTDGKKYLLTAAPNCVLPNHVLGKTFDTMPEAFDHLYIDFADLSCDINREHKFQAQLSAWITYALKGPKIYVQLPSSKELKYYGNRKTVKSIYDKYINLDIYKDHLGGIVLNEASWDAVNVLDGKRYSDFVRDLFDGETPPVPSEPDTKEDGTPDLENFIPPKTNTNTGGGSSTGSTNTGDGLTYTRDGSNNNNRPASQPTSIFRGGKTLVFLGGSSNIGANFMLLVLAAIFSLSLARLMN